MALRYLLDTNMASYIIKGKMPAVRDKLLTVAMAEVGISTVTEAELRFGVARIPEAVRLREVIEEFLLRVEIICWDSDAARAYAKLRATLEETGEPMGNLDMMIAAQALATELVLVTNDRVFRRVKGLKLEDWSRAA